MARLLAYLHARGDGPSLDDALDMAIDAWLDADAQTIRAAGGEAQGYQWKSLLLPHGPISA